MNGVHDMGGMHGMGPVTVEPDEPVFHHDWERRAFALTLASAMQRRWNIDMARFSRELMPPAEYLAASYYERWLWGLERLLVERGLLTLDGVGPVTASDVAVAVGNRRGARMEDHLAAPRFRVGERVRARNLHPIGHTRLPRYARDKIGVVGRDHGVFIFPHAHAATGDKVPQHCYSVRFEGAELWGASAGPRDAIYIDLFDDYLEPVRP